ncbi:MAG: hypothetical protein LLG14_13705 [Nocardiaceae bacterium]|nr:hypothetical protein [Nocardiaceae bacterium]
MKVQKPVVAPALMAAAILMGMLGAGATETAAETVSTTVVPAPTAAPETRTVMTDSYYPFTFATPNPNAGINATAPAATSAPAAVATAGPQAPKAASSGAPLQVVAPQVTAFPQAGGDVETEANSQPVARIKSTTTPLRTTTTPHVPTTTTTASWVVSAADSALTESSVTSEQQKRKMLGRVLLASTAVFVGLIAFSGKLRTASTGLFGSWRIAPLAPSRGRHSARSPKFR